MRHNGRNVLHLENFPLLEDKDLVVRWDALIPAGLGTKYQRHNLVRSSKQLFELICGSSNVAGKLYGETTKLGQFNMLRTLIRWMVSQSIWRFSDIRQRDIVIFIGGRCPRNKVLSERTIKAWLLMFEKMWNYGDKYDCALGIDIRAIEDEIFSEIHARPNKPWLSLEESVTIALIKDALQWIKNFSPFLENVAEISWLHRKKTIGWSENRRRIESKIFYEKIAKDPVYQRLVESLEYKGTIYKNLSVALSITEGACAFLLLVLVGFRASELLSLNKECLVVEEVEGRAGLGYIKGVAAKKRGSPRRWVAGTPVQEVIHVLLRLTKHIRLTRSNSKALFLSRSNGSPLFWVGSRPARWNATILVRRLHAFACSGRRRGGVQVKHLHPHMLRKTFARLAVLRDKSRLEPVAAQLGHMYQSFTDSRYIGIDHDLATLLAEEDRKELATGLEQLLTCESIGGKGAAALGRVRAQAAKFRGRKTLRAFIEKLIDDGVLLGPCHWGFCVYARSHSACNGNETGPNPLHRAPDVCAGCFNLVVTEKHIFWWNRRVRDQEVFLERPDLPEQTRAVMEEKLKKSRGVLASVVWAKAGVTSGSA